MQVSSDAGAVDLVLFSEVSAPALGVARADPSPSLDTSVRIWTRWSWGGGWYQVVTRSLAEDIAFTVAEAERRWLRQGYQRRRRLRDALTAGVASRLTAGRRCRLLTLPYPGASSVELHAAWVLMRHRIRRRTGELEFCGTVAVGDEHGVLHLHVVADWGGSWIGQDELSRWWRELTSYAVVDVRQVKSEGAAAYVARQVGGYVGQQGTGRMVKSRGWFPVSPGASEGVQ